MILNLKEEECLQEKAINRGPGTGTSSGSPPFDGPTFDPPPQYEVAVENIDGFPRPVSSRSGRSPRRRRIHILVATTIVLATIFVHLVKPLRHLAEAVHFRNARKPDELPTTEARWVSCGKGISKKDFLCANITVPLDYHSYGTADNRTAVIAVTKRLATNPDRRIGSLFLNPGGPGGSGTNFAYRRGEYIDKVMQGRYDLIGFDPRGINLTNPMTKCFDSAFASELYAAADYHETFNLPTNFTNFPHVKDDLYRQVSYSAAGFQAAAAQCVEKTGDLLAYAGTEAVVRDIDYMTRLLDGEDARVNFWGFSYGTVIGQYMPHILPRERLGRIAIDGVVNVDHWATDPLDIVSGAEGIDNIDDVIRSFAESCSQAGDACALSHLSATEILAKLDQTIDSLYEHPQPVTGLSAAPGVGVATAARLRSLVFSSAYRITDWPNTAVHLSEIFKGNYTGLLERTMEVVDPADLTKKDGGDFAIFSVACADVNPPAPGYSTVSLTDAVYDSLVSYSHRSGDGFFSLGLCGYWPLPSRSRYPGPFTFPSLSSNGSATQVASLDTPMLVLSQKYDPVTSLRSAKYVVERLGSANARLVEQNGWGHCTISQISYCTAEKVRAFFLDGVLPEEAHTSCTVNQHAFEDFDPSVAVASVEGGGRDARVLMEGWMGLGEEKIGRMRW